MIVLVSATRTRSPSDKEVRSPIGFFLLRSQIVQHVAQLDPVKPQQARKLPFAQQLPVISLSSKQVQFQGRRAVGLGLVLIRPTEIAKHLPNLLIRDAAVRREP